jgi:hypothetical protein
MSLRDIVANVVSIPQRRYVACFFGGGSPRPVRAWPLAWPAPSGPLGWQRLQGQGSARRDATGWSALDAGGARVKGLPEGTRPEGAPLTLEGPAQTMRGVPASLAATSSRLPAHLTRC